MQTSGHPRRSLSILLQKSMRQIMKDENMAAGDKKEWFSSVKNPPQNAGTAMTGLTSATIYMLLCILRQLTTAPLISNISETLQAHA